MVRGRPFLKGNKQGGKPKVDPLVKAFKQITYKQFLDGLQKYGAFSREQMKNELARPDATMFELMFGNIVESASRGDKDARQVLLERLWGKVTEKVEVAHPAPVVIERQSGEQTVLDVEATEAD